MPIRPLRHLRHFLGAGPGEAVAAHADAVAHRLAVAEQQIEIGVRRIDDDRAGRFLALVVDHRPAELRRQRLDRAGLGLVIGRQCRNHSPLLRHRPWRAKRSVLARSSALARISGPRSPVRRDKSRCRRARRQRLWHLRRRRHRRLPKARVPGLAVRHQLRIDFRQWSARAWRLSPRLHDRHDAMDLQPDTFPRSALYKARVQTRRSDLSASRLLLGRGGRDGRRHPKNEQADPTK